MGTPEVALDCAQPVSAAPAVTAVCSSPRHTFSKQPQLHIHLVSGLGVEGDAHHGPTMRHRSRWLKNPHQPNLRQVHLIHSELFVELRHKGFSLRPGDMGENITTRNLNLLQLPAGTRLHVGESAIIEVTGLRNPCVQMDRFLPGLMAATLDRTADGKLVRKAGVMGVVVRSGILLAGDAISLELPPHPHRALAVV